MCSNLIEYFDLVPNRFGNGLCMNQRTFGFEILFNGARTLGLPL
jgi:hypothetical protein